MHAQAVLRGGHAPRLHADTGPAARPGPEPQLRRGAHPHREGAGDQGSPRRGVAPLGRGQRLLHPINAHRGATCPPTAPCGSERFAIDWVQLVVAEDPSGVGRRRTAERPAWLVETVGIEPTSATACMWRLRVCSGLCVSPSARRSPTGLRMASPLESPRIGEDGPHRASLLLTPGPPAAGCEGRGSHRVALTRRRDGSRETPHLWFARIVLRGQPGVLDSQPHPRNRPRRSLSSPWCVYTLQSRARRAR